MVSPGLAGLVAMSYRASSFMRLRWQLRLFTSGICVCFGSLTASAEPLPISLPEDLLPELREILVRAAQQSPSVQQANIEAARTEANYISSRASMLPNLYASGSYSWSENEVRDRPETASKNDGLYYNIGASQPIFHWGALKAQTDISRLEIAIAGKNTEEIYRALTGTLRTQYMALIQKKIGLRNQMYVQKMAEDHLAAQEERLSRGIISTGDILEPRLRAEEARYNTLNAQYDLEATLRVFARLAGRTDLRIEHLPEVLPRPQYAPDLLAEHFQIVSSEVLRDLPQAQVFELRQQQNQKRYHIERTRLLPKLNASAGYGVSNFTTVTPTAVTQTPTVVRHASISANWTLFDGLSSRGGRLAALAATRLAERQLEAFLQTRMDELRTLQGTIQASAQLMDITERRYDLAREAVRLTRQNFELGRVAQSDVDGVVNNANQAEARTVLARSTFLSAWAQYVSLTGMDPVLEGVRFVPDRGRR
jgi:outer membrane protein